jgi:2-C-methyl-D-erythritol 4-phosphate cytidylyltransferase
MKMIDVVIPAAGVGKRMNCSVPKQYLKLCGKTIIEHTIEKILQIKNLGNIFVLIGENDDYFEELKFKSNVISVHGGAERSDSDLNGIKAAKTEFVLIHDAARPCVNIEDINKLISTSMDDNGGILARRVCDTMKRANDDCNILETISRANLFHALTPQLFKRTLLIDAYSKSIANGILVTDEASAMEYMGYHPKLILSSPVNIKITEPLDIKLAELFIKNNFS